MNILSARDRESESDAAGNGERRRRNKGKHYIKCHITLDTETKIVLHSQAVKSLRIQSSQKPQ